MDVEIYLDSSLLLNEGNDEVITPRGNYPESVADFLLFKNL